MPVRIFFASMWSCPWMTVREGRGQSVPSSNSWTAPRYPEQGTKCLVHPLKGFQQLLESSTRPWAATAGGKGCTCEPSCKATRSLMRKQTLTYQDGIAMFIFNVTGIIGLCGRETNSTSANSHVSHYAFHRIGVHTSPSQLCSLCPATAFWKQSSCCQGLKCLITSTFCLNGLTLYL